MRYEELTIEGRNAVLEAFRSGKTIDKLFVLDGCQDGPVRTIVREAKKYDTIINYVAKAVSYTHLSFRRSCFRGYRTAFS